MRRALVLAIGVQILVMASVLVPPLIIRTSGETIYLATEKMDPRALFRGDYVILGYRLAQGILTPEQEQGLPRSTPVYVTITRERPARFVTVGFQRPEPAPDHACLVGRIRGTGARWTSRRSPSTSSPRGPAGCWSRRVATICWRESR